MSKARALADNSSFSPNSDLDGGQVGADVLYDGNVYSTIESTGNQQFDGGSV